MADDLTIKVQAQVASAIKGLAEVQASLGSMAKESVAANAKAASGAAPFKTALADVRKGAGAMAAGVHDVHAVVGSVIGRIRDFAGSLAQLARGFLVGVGAMSPFIGLLTVAGAGLALAHIVKETTAFDKAVYALSLTMNGDVRAASIWLGVGDEVGVTADQMSMAMRFLSTSVEKNSAVLKSMGIATVDAHGKLLPLVDVLEQAHGWFLAHATATNLSAKAVELFGRGGQALLPIMMLDKQTFAEVTSELEKLGLVMSKDSLQASQAFEYEIQHMNTAVKGLTVSLGHALLPGLAALAQALSTWVTANLQRVTEWIARAIAFVVGFMEAITGQDFKLSETAVALGKVANAYGDTGDAADTSAGQAAGMTAAQKKLEEQTRRTVNALESQVATIDAQIRDLEEVNRLESQQVSMARLAEEKAKKEKDIDKLRSDYGQALLIGDLQAAQDINAQLADAQQGEADTERSIKQQADQYDRQTKINSLNDSKSKLQDQVNAVRQAAQDQISAMQAGGAGMSRAIGVSSENIKATVKTMADQLKAVLSSGGEEAGKAWGESVKKWLGDLGSQLQDDARRHGPITAGINAAGKIVGDYFMSGFMQGVQNWLAKSGGDVLGGLAKAAAGAFPAGPLAAGLASSGHAVGWTVPGAPGNPQWALVHGGETISAANSRQGRSRSGNVSLVFNISGSSQPQQTADAVRRVVRQELNDAYGIG